MDVYKVQVTDKALSDMEEIYTYISEQLQAPESAMRQYNRIANAIEKLNIFPERIRLMDLESKSFKGLRQLIVDNYSAFYFIEGERVIVVRVLYSASDINKRLTEE